MLAPSRRKKNNMNNMKKKPTSVPSADRTKPPPMVAMLRSVVCAALTSHSCMSGQCVGVGDLCEAAAWLMWPESVSARLSKVPEAGMHLAPDSLRKRNTRLVRADFTWARRWASSRNTTSGFISSRKLANRTVDSDWYETTLT
jgi:hypothetical protein